MKIKQLLFITCVILFSGNLSNGYAQRIMGAVIGGVNASQVDGDEAYGYHKFGLNVGAAAIVPIGGNWSVSLETLYNEKGSHQRARYLDSLDGSYDLRLNYLDIPILLHYTDKDIVTFGAGISYGRLFNVYEQRNRIHQSHVTLNSGIYKPSDLNLIFDVRFRLVKRLHFDTRYAYSMSKIATRLVEDSKTGNPNIRYQYNGMFTFRLIYIFNEKLSERVRTGQPAK